MKRTGQKSLLCACVIGVTAFCCIRPACGIILHPDNEPNETLPARPDPNVVGRWSSVASFVVVAPNWIVTTRHQGAFPPTVTIGGTMYNCHHYPNNDPNNRDWFSSADLRLIRLTTDQGDNPDLPHYASAYDANDEVGQQVIIGGYGDGRGEILKSGNTVYGYKWDNSSNTTLRWGTNRVDDTNDSDAGSGYPTDILIADFDGIGVGSSTDYEGTIADHDSGGGWFIHDGNEWRLMGLSRLVEVHGSGPSDYESWFRWPTWPYPYYSDYLDGVRVSSYADWINDIIDVNGDLTEDDWVNFADYAILSENWQRDDCNQANSFCDGADFEPPDGIVDYNDLDFMAQNWLTGWQY